MNLRAGWCMLCVGAGLCMCSVAASAVELWSSADGSRYYALDTGLKWTSLLARAPADVQLYPERWSSASLWRWRLAGGGQVREGLNIRVAYEQRARSLSQGAGGAGGDGILLGEGQVPYRLTPLDGGLVQIGDSFAYRHELDRLQAALRLGRGEITVGRQAIGWGRGVLLSAVDFFAPFTPLESDREWRRGIDAVRLRAPLGDLYSLEGVAALSEKLATSAFLARLQGYWGDLDGEVIVGRRRRDWLAALAFSAPVGVAEMHVEAAFFALPEPLPNGARQVLQAVLGGSYHWDRWGGFLLLGEYHYAGLGAPSSTAAAIWRANPSYGERLQLGDVLAESRHVGALQISWGLGFAAPLTCGWVFSPQDQSGVGTLALSWLFSDALTLAASAYAPHGEKPRAGRLRSAYGGAPRSALLQISFYY